MILICCEERVEAVEMGFARAGIVEFVTLFQLGGLASVLGAWRTSCGGWVGEKSNESPQLQGRYGYG
jgi:hypothetical protein